MVNVLAALVPLIGVAVIVCVPAADATAVKVAVAEELVNTFAPGLAVEVNKNPPAAFEPLL